MVIRMKTTKHKRNRNALVVKVDLVAAIPYAFHIQLELKANILIGRQDNVVQRIVTSLTAHQMNMTFVIHSSISFARVFVASNHIDVQHASHFVQRQNRMLGVVLGSDEAYLFGREPHE